MNHKILSINNIDDMYVIVRFQPGDCGEWEFIRDVIGPFPTEEKAIEYEQEHYPTTNYTRIAEMNQNE